MTYCLANLDEDFDLVGMQGRASPQGNLHAAETSCMGYLPCWIQVELCCL